jgi:hypothetical protein
MAEQAVVNAIARELADRGAYFYNLHGSVFGRNGLADFHATYRGHSLFIEAKNPRGGRLRKLQRYELGQAAKAGAIVIVARSRDDVRQALDDIDRRIREDLAA